MKILIVDDDVNFCRHLSTAMTRRGYSVFSAYGGKEALRVARKDSLDAALIDMKMPDMDGLQVVRALKDIHPKLVEIVLTGYGSITNAVKAMKLGADHYLTKPCKISEIEKVLHSGVDQVKDKPPDYPDSIYHGIVGKSPAIRKVIETIRQIKDSPQPVLVCGDSGTGKELVARALHFDSTRKKRPFIAINCVSLKPELIESELFGHVKGSFTGAVDFKEGLLSAADGGTLFIDEIADMHPSVQAGLLRFIETGVYRPVGSTKEQKVDVRIVAAINKNIEEEVRAKRFRHDLYYRINVCRINIPPLNDRREDIPLLVNYLLDSINKAHGKNITLSPSALKYLSEYSWHGNVRELKNVLERGALVGRDHNNTLHFIKTLLMENGQNKICKPTGGSLEELERELLLDNLNLHHWNISRTANALAIDRRTLQRKIKKYGLK